jgi:hypothetical protein
MPQSSGRSTPSSTVQPPAKLDELSGRLPQPADSFDAATAFGYHNPLMPHPFTSASPAARTLSALALASLLGLPLSATGDEVPGRGAVTIPKSSTPKPGDEGVRAHTNIRILTPFDIKTRAKSAVTGLPPYNGYYFETPASLACVYHLVSNPASGCNPNSTTAVVSGGSNAIAIVDAYDYPTAATDLAEFSAQFGLPAPSFTVVHAVGSTPPQDPTGGWELEEALDIEWTHAMAPNARIILVEAASDNISDLLAAVAEANKQVSQAGGGEVSMSWGSAEFPGQKSYDTHFTMPKVVYVAAAGDTPGVEWPSTSPYVISAGGTSTDRNPANGNFIQQNPWQESGGGLSAFEPRFGYQKGVASVVGDSRGVPDLLGREDRRSVECRPGQDASQRIDDAATSPRHDG